MTEQSIQDQDQPNPATVLLVDDEKNVLSSLKRLLRPCGYQILTAESGKQGLEVMGLHEIDLVISDMRMPEMDGAAFLEAVAEKWPQTVRILLTGYSDLSSTIAAVNKGKIYQYLSKPWEDNDLKVMVQRALELKNLQEERNRLLELSQRQNAELQSLNSSLEEKVEERTAELSEAMDKLNRAYEGLKKYNLEIIKILSGLLEQREGSMAGHSRKVAEYARQIAQEMDIPDHEIQQLIFAALLHDVGRIVLPDHILKKPFNALSADERSQVEKHPIVGQSALMSLEPLKQAAKIIRSHHELFDGSGYPDGLSGQEIPLGARILAVANDYDSLQRGRMTSHRLSDMEAREYINRNRVKRYDSRVVKAFLKVFGDVRKPVDIQFRFKFKKDRLMYPHELRDGMILMKDFYTKEGLCLLSQGTRLNRELITNVQDYAISSGEKPKLYVNWLLDKL